MRRFTLTAALCSALAFLAIPVHAEVVQATIPFGFHVGNLLLPAGDYRIDLKGPNGLILIRNIEGKPAALAVATPTGPAEKRDTPLVVFNKIGNEYFLNRLWLPGYSGSHSFPASAREKEAYARASGITVASVSGRYK